MWFVFGKHRTSSLDLGLTLHPTEWVPKVPFLRIKQLDQVADWSHHYIAEIKNTWSCTSTHSYALTQSRGAALPFIFT
jgi:hypothetical protein